MNQEQLIDEFASLAEALVLEKTPHLSRTFNGLLWFEQWMTIPNIGLGYSKPVDLLVTAPDRVKDVMRRITITPFNRPYGL